MKNKEIKVSVKVYFVFMFIFGSLLVAITLLSYSKGTIERDIMIICILLIIILVILFILSKIKLYYNHEYIKFDTIIKTKTIKVSRIKNYYIKSDIKPFRPTFGLYINTIDEKNNIIIPINLFNNKDIRKFIAFLDKKINKKT